MGGFECSCEAGWTAERCNININDCDPNPCQNGGQCHVSVTLHYSSDCECNTVLLT